MCTHILSTMAFWIVFQWEVECSVYAYPFHYGILDRISVEVECSVYAFSFHYGILDCISVGGRV